MKKTILTSICAALLLSTTGISAEAVKEIPSTKSTNQGMAAAYEMLEIMHADESYAKTLDKVLAGQSAMLPDEITSDPKIMKRYNEIIKKFLFKYVSWELIKEDMAKLYAKHYTVAELNDLKKFYLTTTGQKTLQIMPQIAVESMQITQSKMIPHLDEMQEDILNFMKSIKKEEKK